MYFQRKQSRVVMKLWKGAGTDIIEKMISLEADVLRGEEKTFVINGGTGTL